MKKVFFLLFLFLHICVMGQSISVDRMEYDGSRQIMTSSIDMYVGGVEYSFFLKCYFSDYSSSWLLGISSLYAIPDNAILLLKLGNGEVMEIPINNLNVGKLSSSIGLVNYYVSVWKLSADDLIRIKTHGISKLRISASGGGYREKSFLFNRLGEFIKNAHSSILYHKNNYYIPDIHEGF